MAMQALRDGAGTGFLKIILMGLLVMAVGGLVFTDVGGFFRGGVGNNDVARVGDTKIGVVEFDRSVRGILQRANLSPAQAYEFGLVNQILQGQIREVIIRASAAETGLKIPREDIAQNIKEIIQPNIETGETLQDALDRMLRSRGMSERQLVDAIEKETLTSVMSNALNSAGAVTMPNMIADLYAHQGETRSVEMIAFKAADFTDFEQPTDEDISAAYDERKAMFVVPETRDLTLLVLSGDDIKAKITVDEADIRQDYDDNIAAYTTPEKRTITQAVFKTEEEAKAAFDAVKGGKTLKQASGENTLIADQAFAKNELMPALRDPIFAAKIGDTAEPVKSSLGWHVARVSSIAPEKIESFKNTKAEIKETLINDRAGEQLASLADELDELLADGAAPEELADQLPVGLTRAQNVNVQGMNTLSAPAFGGDVAAAVTPLLASAFEIIEGEATTVIEVNAGDYAALFVNSITEQDYKPLNDVKGEIKTALIEQRKSIGNDLTVREFETALKTGDKTLQAFAKDNGNKTKMHKGLKRTDTPPETFTAQTLNMVFNMAPGEVKALPIDGGTALVHLMSADLPKSIGANDEALKEFETTLENTVSSEISGAYISAQQDRLGVRINQGALKRIYGGQDGDQ
jgi:peptidyl-prolyl cis-trans isomerase D